MYKTSPSRLSVYVHQFQTFYTFTQPTVCNTSYKPHNFAHRAFYKLGNQSKATRLASAADTQLLSGPRSHTFEIKSHHSVTVSP